MKHRHSYKIIKQVSLPMLTNHNYYKCKCGAKKDDYDNPAGKFVMKIENGKSR